MVYQPVTHILFDMDGLLLNTEDLYTIGFQKVVSRYNKEFTYELKSKLMGLHSHEFAKIIIEELQLPMTVDEFLAETKEIFQDLFPQCSVLPGVKKLIQHLHEYKIPMGLATSSSLESYTLKAQNHLDLFDLLEYKTYGSSDPSVKRGKPYPDIFIVAAAKFPDQPQPEQCLVFEDSTNGVRAACAAGMPVVMVPDPRLDRSLVPEATQILHSMDDFRPELFGLPAFEN